MPIQLISAVLSLLPVAFGDGAGTLPTEPPWLDAGAIPLVLDEEPAGGWAFEIRPYLWAASVSGQASVGVLPPLDFEVEIGDIVEDLDFAFMLSLEARAPGDDLGIVLDSIYLDLKGTTDAADWELEQRVVELDLAWRVAPQVDLLAGVRYVDFKNAVSIPSVPASDAGEESWVDPILGVRGAFPMGERWSLGLRGDVGGFGVGSEFSWQLAGYVVFDAADWMDLVLGYRHLAIDYVDGAVEIDLAFGGPVLGLNFRL